MTIGKCLDDIKTKRCGIILYALMRSRSERTRLWFLLARHRITGELGDMGGGIKKEEKTLTGGVRELHEESRGIFSDVYKTPSDMASCVTLIDNNADMAEIFAPIDPEWFLIAQDRFQDAAYAKKPLDEMSELVWVSEENMNKLIWGSTTSPDDIMWKRIRTFLQRSIRSREKFYQYLKNQALLFSATQKSLKPVFEFEV